MSVCVSGTEVAPGWFLCVVVLAWVRHLQAVCWLAEGVLVKSGGPTDFSNLKLNSDLQ